MQKKRIITDYKKYFVQMIRSYLCINSNVTVCVFGVAWKCEYDRWCT